MFYLRVVQKPTLIRSDPIISCILLLRKRRDFTSRVRSENVLKKSQRLKNNAIAGSVLHFGKAGRGSGTENQL